MARVCRDRLSISDASPRHCPQSVEFPGGLAGSFTFPFFFRKVGAMGRETTRRDFLRAGSLTTAGLVAVGTAPEALADAGPGKKDNEEHPHGKEFPRDRPGSGGPVGSDTDRGKLVPGRRAAGEPPVPVETPDLTKLPWKMV